MTEKKFSWKWRITGLFLYPIAIIQLSMPQQDDTCFYLSPVKCWNLFRTGFLEGNLNSSVNKKEKAEK